MESDSPPSKNWRLVLLAVVFCGSAAASCVLGWVYWRDVLDLPYMHEADGTVLEMASELTDHKYVWEAPVVWRVQYSFRDAAGGQRTGIDRVPTSTTLRRNDTVRVWYTDERTGLVVGLDRSAAWGKWVFLGAVVVGGVTAIVLVRIALRRVRAEIAVTEPVPPQVGETNPGRSGAASTGDWVRND